MSREIKFRAWYKPKRKMYSKSLESINFEAKVLGVYTTDGYRQLRLSDFELMQYTGLIDMNGKLIYEGDIVRVHEGDDFKWEQKVEYFNASFVVDENALGAISHFCEVIGNIYENPELLGTKDE